MKFIRVTSPALLAINAFFVGANLDGPHTGTWAISVVAMVAVLIQLTGAAAVRP